MGGYNGWTRISTDLDMPWQHGRGSRLSDSARSYRREGLRLTVAERFLLTDLQFASYREDRLVNLELWGKLLIGTAEKARDGPKGSDQAHERQIRVQPLK
jgi:hypothetical protein